MATTQGQPQQQPPNVGGILIVIAACSGIVWNYVTISDLQKKNVEREFQEWQENEVFSLVVDAGTEGDTKDHFYNRYLKLSEDQTRPKHDLNEQTFHQALVGLISKRVVLPVGSDRYRLLADSDLYGGGHCGFEVINHLMPRAMEALQSQNGTLDQFAVMKLFHDKYDIKSGECQLLLHFLFNNKMIGTHKTTKKVWNLIARSDMAPQCDTGFVPLPIPDPLLQQRAADSGGFTPRPYDPSSDIGEAKPQVPPESGLYQRVPRRAPRGRAPATTPAPYSTPAPVAN